MHNRTTVTDVEAYGNLFYLTVFNSCGRRDREQNARLLRRRLLDVEHRVQTR